MKPFVSNKLCAVNDLISVLRFVVRNSAVTRRPLRHAIEIFDVAFNDYYADSRSSEHSIFWGCYRVRMLYHNWLPTDESL